MKENTINILIAEPSYIVSEGLTNILSRRGTYQFNILKADELSDIEQIRQQNNIDVVLINPLLIQNQIKTFNNLKRDLGNTQWIGVIYSLFDHQLTSMFDSTITINDSPGHIINSIQKLLESNPQTEKTQQAETLSEREIEVLKLLVSGNSNKEIADKLFISTHTVITHRKNISQKTGIKSVSGLTIYAVVNNIISLESFE